MGTAGMPDIEKATAEKELLFLSPQPPPPIPSLERGCF